MPLISARHLPEEKPYWRRLILRVPKSRLQLLFGSRNSGSIVAVIAAAAMPECSGEPRQAGAGKCDKKKYDAAVHSRFADKELGLICNNNFV